MQLICNILSKFVKLNGFMLFVLIIIKNEQILLVNGKIDINIYLRDIIINVYIIICIIIFLYMEMHQN